MSEQSGYNKVIFYELNSLVITYDGSGFITNIATSGDIITVSEVEQNFPEVEYDIIEAENNDIKLNITIKCKFNDLTTANITNMSKLTNSIYGFAACLYRKNDTEWLINSPFKCNFEEVDTNKSHIFYIEMNAKTIKLFEKLA